MAAAHEAAKGETFNFRLDPTLKAEFLEAAEKEDRPAGEILRHLIRTFVDEKRRQEFVAEARRQSALLIGDPQEREVLDRIGAMADVEGWK